MLSIFPAEFLDAEYDSEKVKLLPTLHSKLTVFKKYQTACEDANHQQVSLWIFRKFWNSLFFNIFATKPTTDLA